MRCRFTFRLSNLEPAARLRQRRPRPAVVDAAAVEDAVAAPVQARRLPVGPGVVVAVSAVAADAEVSRPTRPNGRAW